MTLRSHFSNRRAFALPGVVLLTLVAGVLIAAMLDRQGAQSLTNQRQLDEYRAYHFGKGLREVIDAWLNTGIDRPFQERLGPDGLAMELHTPDGVKVRVSLFDAQGAVLRASRGLSGPDGELMLRVIRALSGEQDNDPPTQPAPPLKPGLLRSLGPPPISLQAAPDEVLLAVLTEFGDASAAARGLEWVRAERAKGRFTDDHLARFAVEAGLPAQNRDAAMRLFTASPHLWRVVAEVSDAPAGSPAARGDRFQGLVYLKARVNAGGTPSNEPGMPGVGSFLTWARVQGGLPRE